MKQFFARSIKPFAPTPGTTQVPDNLWVKCAQCKDLIYRGQFEDNLKVCPKCDHHTRLTAREWVTIIADPGSFQEHERTLEAISAPGGAGASGDYAHKLREMREKTGLSEALVCGAGAIEGLPIELAVTDFRFMGGSMGAVYGEKIACAVERATARNVPLITINASGGARMYEGILSLMQMAKVSVALLLLAQARQLHISILVDPCYGGVSASYASIADVILAEPGAHIGFAGPRVIAQTVKQRLPVGFQTAEFLRDHGMIDAVLSRRHMRAALALLLHIHAPRIWPTNTHYVEHCQ